MNAAQARAAIAAGTMTQALWSRLPRHIRAESADNSQLCAELVGFEGCRVSATHYGERIHFKIGKSTGWRPIHIRLHNARSHGGEGIMRGTLSNVQVTRT